MMSKLIFRSFAIILGIISLTSCNEDDANVVSILPYTLDWEVPAGLNNFETHFFEFTNIDNRKEEFFSSDFPLSNIKSIRARRADLVLTDNNINFDQIRNIEVWIYSDVNEEKDYEVFYTLDLRNQSGRQAVSLIPSLSNIIELYTEDTFTLEVRINFWTVSSANLPIRMEWEFEALK